MNHPWLLLINPMLANNDNILHLGKKIKNLRQTYKLWTLPSSTIFSSNLYKNSGDNENEGDEEEGWEFILDTLLKVWSLVCGF